jgi:uncharacterized membrane protein
MTNSIPNSAAPTQETFNAVLVDMLRGVKTASGEVFAASKTMIVKAIDFAQDQAPLVVQEFLKWKMCESIIYLIVGIFAIGISGFFIKKILASRTETKENYSIDGNPCVIGSVVLSIVSAIVFFAVVVPNTLRIVKITVAPRVYLIEYASDLYNGNTYRGSNRN